jgi:octaprenyl-diphosphate synthase
VIAIFASLAPRFADVEAVMTRALASEEPRVQSLIDGLGSFHGKMLRPALVLLTAEAVGAVGPDHVRLGAALELIHTATLIHDDMIDEAATRRGQPTAHVEHGTSIAVLLGDYFYTHAFNLVADLEQRWVLPRLTRTTNVICRGELHQMIARRDLALTEAEYERIIHAKTAALCELAGELGALTAEAPVRAAAAAFGRACGMAFQIVDDCLDFTGDAEKVGKTLATDIERGRLTLPLIRMLAKAAPDRRAALGRQLLDTRTPEDVARLRRVVLDSGAIPDAIATARGHVAEAVSHLAGLPPGAARDRLADLAEFIVARDF